MWVAILITVAAAAGNNIGKVLQKQATKNLPKFSLKREVLQEYFRSRHWLTGVAADVSGALLMIAAFALAPVSVVQPVSAVGLIILLVFSHFYLHERLKPHEWAAAAVAFLGILGLGLSSDGAGGAAQQAPSTSRMVLAFATMLVLLGAEVAWRQRHQSRAARFPASAAAAAAQEADALLCGLEAGACFGFSAGACKTGFLLASKAGWVFAPVGLAGSVLLTSSGFVQQTRGLKNGSTIMVCTAAAATSMVSGVLVGLVALGETLPGSWKQQLARLASWALIFAGVLCLAPGTSSIHRPLRAVLRQVVPGEGSKLWKWIPRGLALPLRRLSKNLNNDESELPMHHG